MPPRGRAGSADSVNRMLINGYTLRAPGYFVYASF